MSWVEALGWLLVGVSAGAGGMWLVWVRSARGDAVWRESFARLVAEHVAAQSDRERLFDALAEDET